MFIFCGTTKTKKISNLTLSRNKKTGKFCLFTGPEDFSWGLPKARGSDEASRWTGRGRGVCAWPWNCIPSFIKERLHFLKQPIPIMTRRKRIWSISSLKRMGKRHPALHSAKSRLLPASAYHLCLKRWMLASSPFTFKENSKTYKVNIKYILRQIHSGSDALNR